MADFQWIVARDSGWDVGEMVEEEEETCGRAFRRGLETRAEHGLETRAEHGRPCRWRRSESEYQ